MSDTEQVIEVTQKEPPFAMRGGQWMPRDELEAHFAALIRLENVGVLLGSGASTGNLGGKTVYKLWKSFQKDYSESYQWLIDKNFIQNSDDVPNIESLFDALEIASVEWERQKWSRRLKELVNAQNDLKRSVIKASLLKKDWWEYPDQVDATEMELFNHRIFLQRLTAARQPGQPFPWIFTTNYDLAIEWAAESVSLKVINGFEGLHNRTFSPHSFDLGFRNLLAKGEARFGTYSINLVKLHGSLSWKLSKDRASYVEFPVCSIWQEIKSFIETGTTEHFSCPVIFPSAAKYLQTVGFVLGELIRRFTEFLSKPQTCLIICGYSFSDEHLNQIIIRALQNPTLQLMILLPRAEPAEKEMNFERCSNWIKKISSLGSPQITIVGGKEKAYFRSLVQYLPDPVIYDEHSLKIRDILRQLKTDKNGSGNL